MNSKVKDDKRSEKYSHEPSVKVTVKVNDDLWVNAVDLDGRKVIVTPKWWFYSMLTVLIVSALAAIVDWLILP